MASTSSRRSHAPIFIRQAAQTKMNLKGLLAYAGRLRHFKKTAKRIDEFYLTRGPASHLEKSWIGDYDRHAPRTRDGNIQPIEAVQKLHTSWRIIGA